MSMPAVSKHLKVLERAGLDRPRARSAMAALQNSSGSPQGCIRLAGTLPRGMGAETRPPGRLPAELKKKEKKRGRKKEPVPLRTLRRGKSSSRVCSTRRANWSGRHGPIPSRSSIGGGHGASLRRSMRWTSGPGGVWRPHDARTRRHRISQQERLSGSREAGANRLLSWRRKQRAIPVQILRRRGRSKPTKIRPGSPRGSSSPLPPRATYGKDLQRRRGRQSDFRPPGRATGKDAACPGADIRCSRGYRVEGHDGNRARQEMVADADA